jgi:hypothetical protein
MEKPNNQPFRGPSQPDDRRNYNDAGLIGFVKSAFTAGWVYLMKLGRGTSITTYQAVTGNNVEIAAGTSSAPLTAAAPVMKVSGTFSQSKASIYGGNAGVTEGSTAITAEVVSLAAGDTQVAAIMASALNNSTTAGADGGGIFAIGISSASSSGVGGFGAYLQGQHNAVASYAVGAEIRAQNESGTDDAYTGSNDHSTGVILSAGGTGGKKCAVAATTHAAGSTWIAGYQVESGSVTDYSFIDRASSTYSIHIGGAHSYGLDTVDGAATFSQAAIRIAKDHSIKARNNGNTADVVLIQKENAAADRVQIATNLIIDPADGMAVQDALTALAAGTNITIGLAGHTAAGTRLMKPDKSVYLSFRITCNAAIGAGATVATITNAHKPTAVVPLVTRKVSGGVAGVTTFFILNTGAILPDVGLANGDTYEADLVFYQ